MPPRIHSLRHAGAIVVLLLTVSRLLYAQASDYATDASFDDYATIRIDREASVAMLRNETRYYIRRHSSPAHEIELRLVVRLGYVMENPESRPIAHIIQHLALEGTPSFPKEEIDAFLRASGMTPVADSIATSGFNYTIYRLRIKGGDSAALRTAIRLLHTWAREMPLGDAEIERARASFVAELSGANAVDRANYLLAPFMYGTPFAGDPILGDRSAIASIPADSVRSFYTTSYAPSALTIVAVGDLDTALTAAMVRPLLDSIPWSRRPYLITPANFYPSRSAIRITRDSVHDQPSVSINTVLHHAPMEKVRDVEDQIREEMVVRVLTARLAERVAEKNSPFITARASRTIIGGYRKVIALEATTKKEKVREAIEELSYELERARTLGISNEEIMRAGIDLREEADWRWALRDTATVKGLADRFAAHALWNSPAWGPEYDYEFRRHIPGLEGGLKKLAQQLLGDPAESVVLVDLPLEGSSSSIDEQGVRSAVAKGAKRKVEEFEYHILTSSLISNRPAPGKIVATRKFPDAGIIEWTLSNGARVILRNGYYYDRTDFVSAVSAGGSSLIGDSDFVEGSDVAAIINRSGAGPFTRFDLNRRLHSTQTYSNVFIGEGTEGITINSSSGGLETMLQLLYLSMTEPRVDSLALPLQKWEWELDSLWGVSWTHAIADDTMRAILSGYDRRHYPLSARARGSITPEKALAIYRERFRDASDFTFLLVGGFDPERARPLVERYIGSLPSFGTKETFRDRGVRAPSGPITKEAYGGGWTHSELRLVYTGPMEWTAANRIRVEKLADKLDDILGNAISESERDLYYPTVRTTLTRIPSPRYAITIDIDSRTDRIYRIEGIIESEIERLGLVGLPPKPKEEFFGGSSTYRESPADQMMGSASFWLDVMSDMALYGDDPVKAMNEARAEADVTPAALKQAVKTFLDPSRLIKVVVHPEKKGR